MKKYIFVLLAVCMLVTGMAANAEVAAANSVTTQKITKIGNSRVYITVKLKNVDLKIYEKYNHLLRKEFPFETYGDDNLAFGKALPGTKVEIDVTTNADLSKHPLPRMNILVVHQKMAKKFPGIPGTDVTTLNKSGVPRVSYSFTVPKGVDIFRITIQSNHHDATDNIFASYDIVTSDEAFKKAYQILTGKRFEGTLSPSGAVKKAVDKTADATKKVNLKKNNEKTKTGQKEKPPAEKNKTEKDSGGVGAAEVGAAVAVAGAGAWVATRLGGGGGGTDGRGNPGKVPEPPVPSEPDYYLYKDPAGYETLYMKDPETGNWYNYQDYQEGYRTPVDMDKLQEYDAQRQQDVKWNQDQMTKLQNRETGLDRELKQEYQDMLERERQLQEEAKQNLLGLKTNTYGLDKEERRRVMEERQARDQKDVDRWTKRADAWDTVTKTAEVVQKAADMGVDALAVATAPVGGQLIADVYTGAKNIGGNVMDAAVNNKSIVDAAIKGAAQAGADIVQGHAGGKWAQKLAAYAGSEALKEGIVAAVDGENAVKAALKGGLQGACKWGIESAGDVMKGDFRQRAKNTLTQRNKEIQNMWGKSDISKKSLNELEALQYRRFFQREQAILAKQGLGQTIAKETTSAIGDMTIKGKSFSEAEFGEKW